MVRCKHIDSQTVGTVPPLSCYTAIGINGSRLAVVYNIIFTLPMIIIMVRSACQPSTYRLSFYVYSSRYCALYRSAAPAFWGQTKLGNKMSHRQSIYRSYGAHTWEGNLCRSCSRSVSDRVPSYGMNKNVSGTPGAAWANERTHKWTWITSNVRSLSLSATAITWQILDS